MPTLTRDDGTKLTYVTYGDALTQATPIVFLNGMTQTTLSWKTLARSMQAEFPIITYDARGQGESEVGEKSLELELHADDLAALLDALEVERAHLVGFSHGARVALAFANHHPERLDHLVLCSATARPTALARTIIRGWREILAAGGLEAMSWASLTSILGKDYLEQNEKLIPGIIRASVQRNQREGVTRLLDAMLDYPDLADLARGVRAATLVIYGEQDQLVDAEGAKELATLAGGESLLVDGVGHTVPIEAPDVFRESLRDFLPIS